MYIHIILCVLFKSMPPIYHSQLSNTAVDLEKVNEITDTINTALKALCGCDTVVAPVDLVCDIGGDKTTVIYYGAVADNSLIEHLVTFVKETDEVTVSGTKLTINTDCPVKIDEIDNKKCDSPKSGERSGSNNSAAAVAAPVVVILVVLVAAVVVLLAGFIYWRRRMGKYPFIRYVCTPPLRQVL